MNKDKSPRVQFWKKYLLLVIGVFVLLEITVVIGAQFGASTSSNIKELFGLLTVPLFYLANFFHFARFNPGLFTDFSPVGIVFNLIFLLYISVPVAIIVSLLRLATNKKRWQLFIALSAILFGIAWLIIQQV